MPRTLILTRHAKSDWDDETLSDHQRPLNRRGRTAAPLVGKALAARGLIPDQVLCSTATRTQETWTLMAPELAGAPEATLLHALYHASPETMLGELKAATGDVVLLIGHNPGIASLAHRLVRTPAPHARFIDFPTGATLIARTEDWGLLGFKTAEMVDFFVPRDLA